MKDIYQVLRLKEEQIDELRRQVDALRTVAPMLGDQADASSEPEPSDEPIPIRKLP